MTKKEETGKPRAPKYILVYACNKCGETRRIDSPRKKFPMPPPVGFVDHKQQEHPGTGPIDSFWHCGVFRPFAVYKLMPETIQRGEPKLVRGK